LKHLKINPAYPVHVLKNEQDQQDREAAGFVLQRFINSGRDSAWEKTVKINETL
jgi:hypothetical protein